jgi:hypothetical protein
MIETGSLIDWLATLNDQHNPYSCWVIQFYFASFDFSDNNSIVFRSTRNQLSYK